MTPTAKLALLALALVVSTAASAQYRRPPQSAPKAEDKPGLTRQQPAPGGNTPAWRGSGAVVPEPNRNGRDGDRDRDRHNPRNPRHCRHCGPYDGYYHYNYGAYYVPYAVTPGTTLAQPTATDRVLANGGTFNTGSNATSELDTAPPSPSRTAPDSGLAPVATSADLHPELPRNDFISAADGDPAILVFGDGHREEVANYAILGHSIFVLSDGRKIAFAELDLPATLRANESAGYSFRVPGSALPSPAR
ncbi:MAG TPA: hypothetical protein VEG32_09250 [Clostridia bacterium]|nr:hypothetical protein [Clostridia bacterium]